MDQRDREIVACAVAFVVWLAVVVVIVSLFGCANTEMALAQLPEGYWLATERLLVGIGADVWAAVEWVAALLL